MTTLLIRGHGRWPYLHQAVQSIDAVYGWERFDRTVLSLDGGCEIPDGLPFDEIHQLPSRQGLVANLDQGWAAVCDDDWVFDTEEDFTYTDLPLESMAFTLAANPTVANMVLMRQPITPEEIRAGSVLGGQHLRGRYTDRGWWVEHDAGYWLNPSLVRGPLLAALTPDVETGLTVQCRERGLSFAYWGTPTDPPRCEHIGTSGGMNSEGWKP